jgi:hypothetical protein
MRGKDGHVNVTFCHADFFAGLLTLFFHRLRKDRLLSQQLCGIDCEGAACGDEGGYDAEQEHCEEHSSQYQRLAWRSVGDEV